MCSMIQNCEKQTTSTNETKNLTTKMFSHLYIPLRVLYTTPNNPTNIKEQTNTITRQ